MTKFFITAASLVVLYHFSFAQIKVASSGIVGVGTNAPAYPLEVKATNTRFTPVSTGYPSLQLGVFSSDPRIQSNNKVVFYKLDNSGYINIEAGTVYEYSDRAAKENITALTLKTESPLSVIKKLNGVSYTWKNDASKQEQIGFVAQDVEQVLPQVVNTVDSSGSKTMSYTHIIPYLVEAIKEQQVIIEDLKTQVKQMGDNIKVVQGNLNINSVNSDIQLYKTEDVFAKTEFSTSQEAKVVKKNKRYKL